MEDRNKSKRVPWPEKSTAYVTVMIQCQYLIATYLKRCSAFAQAHKTVLLKAIVDEQSELILDDVRQLHQFATLIFETRQPKPGKPPLWYTNISEIRELATLLIANIERMKSSIPSGRWVLFSGRLAEAIKQNNKIKELIGEIPEPTKGRRSGVANEYADEVVKRIWRDDE